MSALALIPDPTHPFLWRIRYPSGELSVKFNSTKAVNLAYAYRKSHAYRKSPRAPQTRPGVVKSETGISDRTDRNSPMPAHGNRLAVGLGGRRRSG
jgi:hypothetical protein